ncbi:MAG: threonine synthase [Candidatus Thorarchaeota archaeon]|nr:threonine synthase [Candidatus Thorarchaeota archaeon]
MISAISHLECPECLKQFAPETPATVCICGSPLFARYHLNQVVESVDAEEFPADVNSLWRYSLLLPVTSPSFVLSLGEGWTPLVLTRRLGTYYGLRVLRVKDESRNPTLSFKDRGLCVAISKHTELGATAFTLPSAGNAAVSTSAYSAVGGVPAFIFMPEDTPQSFFQDCQMYGAITTSNPGTISDSAALMRKSKESWTDLSTTKEPYRVEGKKTLAFEIAEQMGWSVPDAIVCPTGGGTALIGIWKGLDELEAIGLIGTERPRLYAAQSGGCAPVVRAFEMGADTVEPWKNGETKAYGLRVPSPFAGRLIMRALYRSGGGAVAVAEHEIAATVNLAAKLEGLDICPEAAVGLAGLSNLIESGQVDYDEDVVVLNTGSGVKYRQI